MLTDPELVWTNSDGLFTVHRHEFWNKGHAILWCYLIDNHSKKPLTNKPNLG
jgi:hypothetical protein